MGAHRDLTTVRNLNRRFAFTLKRRTPYRISCSLMLYSSPFEGPGGNLKRMLMGTTSADSPRGTGRRNSVR